MAARVSRVADLPENDLQDVPKNRIGTGPLFCRYNLVDISFISPIQPDNRFFSSAWTSFPVEVPASGHTLGLFHRRKIEKDHNPRIHESLPLCTRDHSFIHAMAGTLVIKNWKETGLFPIKTFTIFYVYQIFYFPINPTYP
jgi:hypothetical protein